MSEQDDRLDQRELAALWRLEDEDRAERRVELTGGRFVSLFVEAPDGRSYIFEHGSDAEAAVEAISVGDAEFERYATADEARAAFAARLRELRETGEIVDLDSEQDEFGAPGPDGPVLSDTARENLENT